MKSTREDKALLASLDDIFKVKRGRSFSMPQKNEPVILLLSGGADSIPLWQLLMEKYKLQVYPLHVKIKNNPIETYAQISAIRYYEHIFRKEYPDYFRPVHFINHEWQFSFGNPGKLKFDDPYFIKKNYYYYKEYDINLLLVSKNPSRLGTYAGYAYEYALTLKHTYSIQPKTIIFGIVANDSEFTYDSTLSTLRSINLYICNISQDYSFQISAAIEKDNNFYYSSVDLLKFSDKKGVDLSKTRSCQSNLLLHCGRCPSCYKRKDVFKKTGIIDKTQYLSSMKIFKMYSHLKATVLNFNSSPDRPTQKPISLKVAPYHRLKIAPHANWQIESGQVILLDKKNLLYEEFNESATFLWILLSKNKHTVGEIIEIFRDEYDLSKDKATIDVMKFIDYYINSGLLILQSA